MALLTAMSLTVRPPEQLMSLKKPHPLTVTANNVIVLHGYLCLVDPYSMQLDVILTACARHQQRRQLQLSTTVRQHGLFAQAYSPNNSELYSVVTRLALHCASRRTKPHAIAAASSRLPLS